MQIIRVAFEQSPQFLTVGVFEPDRAGPDQHPPQLLVREPAQPFLDRGEATFLPLLAQQEPADRRLRHELCAQFRPESALLSLERRGGTHDGHHQRHRCGNQRRSHSIHLFSSRWSTVVATRPRRVMSVSVDIEQQVRRVWGADVRPTVSEAWRCYGSGAYRACLAMTWAAVSADLIDKVTRLADDGEGEATPLATTIRTAQTAGLSTDGVRAMQEVEREIIKVAVKTELVDEVTARELERLREDRHLSVHPSLRGLGEPYAPSAEYARAHLASALDGLLTQPPSQGRKAVERFIAHVSDVTFVPSSGYLTHVFHDQVRSAARRGIIDLAAKHALLELPAVDPPGATVIADRMAACLRVFAARDRGAVRDALAKTTDRLEHATNDVLVRAVGRVGDLDVLWEVLPDALVDRIRDLVDALPLPAANDWDGLTDVQADLLSLAAVAPARDVLPVLLQRFESTSTAARAAAMARRVSAFFAPYVPGILDGAGSYRTAEARTQQAVLPYAGLLDLDTLNKTLNAWSENSQCREAGGMIHHAVELYHGSPHLHPGDRQTWQDFLDRVRAHEPPGSHYRYDELEAALGA